MSGRRSSKANQQPPDSFEEMPYPRNLLRETSRSEHEDPPNLHRLTARETLENHRVVEMHDRFAVGGVLSTDDER